MKNTINLLGILLALAIVALPTQAQEWSFGLHYQAATPGSDTKEIADDFSFRNAALDARKMVSDRTALGFYVGWNVFAEEFGEGTLSFAGADVTGVQNRFVNSVPILFQATQYLGDQGAVRPFIGLGLGTYWTESRVEIAQVALTQDEWHFGISPEIGVEIPTQDFAETYLTVKYHYAFEANDLQHSYFTFGVGIAYGF